MASAEIKGSRENSDENKTFTANQLYVSDDGIETISLADKYTDDAALGVVARFCVRTRSTPEIIPGIWMHIYQFQGFHPY